MMGWQKGRRQQKGEHIFNSRLSCWFSCLFVPHIWNLFLKGLLFRSQMQLEFKTVLLAPPLCLTLLTVFAVFAFISTQKKLRNDSGILRKRYLSWLNDRNNSLSNENTCKKWSWSYFMKNILLKDAFILLLQFSCLSVKMCGSSGAQLLMSFCWEACCWGSGPTNRQTVVHNSPGVFGNLASQTALLLTETHFEVIEGQRQTTWSAYYQTDEQTTWTVCFFFSDPHPHPDYRAQRRTVVIWGWVFVQFLSPASFQPFKTYFVFLFAVTCHLAACADGTKTVGDIAHSWTEVGVLCVIFALTGALLWNEGTGENANNKT